MRKIYSFLMVGVLGLLSVFSAKAQSKYWEVDAEIVTEIEPNTNYVLTNAFNSSTKYLNGNSFSTQAGDGTIYQFVEVGTTENGDKTYHLKQVSTGLFLEDPDLSGESVTMTASAARAYTFTAKISVPCEYYKEADLNAQNIDRTTFTYAGGSTGVSVKENSFVFCNINWASSKYDYFTMYSAGSNGWKQYSSTNVWWLYKASKLGGYDSFCLMMEDLFPNGATPSTKFFIGENPGQVDAESFNALQTAYDKCMKLMQEMDLPSGTYDEAGEELNNALNNAKAARKPFKPGYYVLRSRYASYGNNHASIYDKGTQLGWEEFDPETTAFTAENANHIWKIEEGDNEGEYFLQNYSTGNYVGKQASNNAVFPTVAAESRQMYNITEQDNTGDYFAIHNKTVNASYPALNVRSDKVIVSWSVTGSAAGWRFQKVSDDVIKALEAQVEQRQRNQEAVTLVQESRIALGKGISLKSDATKDGNFDNLGLAADSTKLFTNAQEPKEGPIKNLVDNNEASFFHTTWSVSLSDVKYAFVGADLGEAVQCVDIKYARRNATNTGVPTTVHVYATNELTDDPTKANWVDQGYVAFDYVYAANETFTTAGAANFAGISGVMFDAPYRYIRLDVEHTMNDAKSAGNLYFSLSELRFYKGQYDAENSLIAAVPENVVNALKENVAKVQKLIGEGADISLEDFNALQASLKAFNEAFPDMSLVNKAITEAEAQLEAAEEGTEIGYFAPGSKSALSQVVESARAQIKPVMTASEILSVSTLINEGLNKFAAALNTPEDGDVVFIKSVTSGAAANNYLYAVNSGTDAIKWGGYSATTGIDEHLNNRLNYMWKFIKNDDGTISLRNLGTGSYMRKANTLNVAVIASLTPDSLSYRSAKMPGVFNLIVSEGLYANAQPTTGNIVAWNGANKDDNSAFELVPVADSWENAYYFALDKQTQVVTLPMDINGISSYGYLYRVLGVKAGAVQLESYGESDVIPAGTPFIFVPNSDVDWVGGTEFYPVASSLSEIEVDVTAKSQNGLYADFWGSTMPAGYGFLYKGVVTISVDGDKLSANSGYFTDEMPTTEEDGEMALKIEGTIITNIQNAAVATSEKVDVYTLSGVAVRRQVKVSEATKQLPAGLYIVGGKKVLVK